MFGFEPTAPTPAQSAPTTNTSHPRRSRPGSEVGVTHAGPSRPPPYNQHRRPTPATRGEVDQDQKLALLMLAPHAPHRTPDASRGPRRRCRPIQAAGTTCWPANETTVAQVRLTRVGGRVEGVGRSRPRAPLAGRPTRQPSRRYTPSVPSVSSCPACPMKNHRVTARANRAASAWTLRQACLRSPHVRRAR